MRLSITYPMVQPGYDPAFVTQEGLTRFAQTAEEAGLDAIAFTDHPAPTHKWVESGGHDALDPFAALAFCAAVTTRLRLMPNIAVLPYRSPFVVAKAVATIDRLSGGRFTLAVGAGYLRGEFEALGVPYDERNERFDEALDVLRGVWNQDDFSLDGAGFSASGQTARPRPVQDRVPIWIGGNSARARQRVADHGDGWAPFPAPPGLSRTAKTPSLVTDDDLAETLDDLWARVEAAGRHRSEIDVSWHCRAGGNPLSDDFDTDVHQEGLARLADLGVTWCGVGVDGRDLEAALDGLGKIGDRVVEPSRS